MRHTGNSVEGPPPTAAMEGDRAAWRHFLGQERTVKNKEAAGAREARRTRGTRTTAQWDTSRPGKRDTRLPHAAAREGGQPRSPRSLPAHSTRSTPLNYSIDYAPPSFYPPQNNTPPDARPGTNGNSSIGHSGGGGGGGGSNSWHNNDNTHTHNDHSNPPPSNAHQHHQQHTFNDITSDTPFSNNNPIHMTHTTRTTRTTRTTQAPWNGMTGGAYANAWEQVGTEATLEWTDQALRDMDARRNDKVWYTNSSATVLSPRRTLSGEASGARGTNGGTTGGAGGAAGGGGGDGQHDQQQQQQQQPFTSVELATLFNRGNAGINSLVWTDVDPTPRPITAHPHLLNFIYHLNDAWMVLRQQQFIQQQDDVLSQLSDSVGQETWEGGEGGGTQGVRQHACPATHRVLCRTCSNREHQLRQLVKRGETSSQTSTVREWFFPRQQSVPVGRGRMGSHKALSTGRFLRHRRPVIV